MQVVTEFLALAQEGKKVVLYYAGDEAFGGVCTFKEELEAV